MTNNTITVMKKELARFFGEFERYGDQYYAWLESGQSLNVWEAP